MTVNTAGRTVTLSTRVRPQLSTRALIRVGLLTVICLVPFALLGAIGGLAVFQRMTNKQFQVAVSLLLAILFGALVWFNFLRR